MKKINFSQILISSDISSKHCQNVDARESFANILYTQGNGIVAHALAFKIYNSSGELEYTDEEILLIKEYANAYCRPFFIEGINRMIDHFEKEKITS